MVSSIFINHLHAVKRFQVLIFAITNRLEKGLSHRTLLSSSSWLNSTTTNFLQG